MQTPLDNKHQRGYVYYGTREDFPTVSKSNKKGSFLMDTFVLGPNDLKTATEIIEIADKVMQSQNADLKFEHLLVWWLATDPAEA